MVDEIVDYRARLGVGRVDDEPCGQEGSGHGYRKNEEEYKQQTEETTYTENGLVSLH